MALGLLQAVVVLTKPLPAYFRGRAGGPAEDAIVGDRGAELYGQPATGYRLATRPTVVRLQRHNVVYTADETRQLLADNKVVEDRIEYRASQAGADRQFTLLRQGEAVREAAIARAQANGTQAVVTRLEQVEKAIKQQEYYRLNEQDGLVRRMQREHGHQNEIGRRYKFK